MKRMFKRAARLTCCVLAASVLAGCATYGGSTPARPMRDIRDAIRNTEYTIQSNRESVAAGHPELVLPQVDPRLDGCYMAGRWLEWFAQDEARARAGGQRQFGPDYDQAKRDVKAHFKQNACPSMPQLEQLMNVVRRQQMRTFHY